MAGSVPIWLFDRAAARFVIKAVPDAILSDRAISHKVITARIPNISNVLVVGFLVYLFYYSHLYFEQ